ncbi:MAG: hypothetical protein GY827_11155 [Cytophagales bacterium]|nr:hypothetical protein [Cytophagales bacterium]
MSEKQITKSSVTGCGKIIIWGIVSLFVLFFLFVGGVIWLSNSADMSKYKSEYTWEEDQLFENKRDSLLLANFQKEMKEIAQLWNEGRLEQGNPLTKADVELFYFAEQSTIDNVFTHFFVRASSFPDIAAELYKKEEGQIFVEDESLKVLNHGHHDFMGYSDKENLQYVSGIPYLFVLDGAPTHFAQVELKDTVTVTVIDRNEKKIVDKFSFLAQGREPKLFYKSIISQTKEHYKRVKKSEEN